LGTRTAGLGRQCRGDSDFGGFFEKLEVIGGCAGGPAALDLFVPAARQCKARLRWLSGLGEQTDTSFALWQLCIDSRLALNTLKEELRSKRFAIFAMALKRICLT